MAEGGGVMPKRIVFSRKKGARLPANAVLVARPSRFGNPFPIGVMSRGFVIDQYETGLRVALRYLAGDPVPNPEHFAYLSVDMAEENGFIWRARHLAELRGKDLACNCKLSEPCHADVLLELANQPEEGAEK